MKITYREINNNGYTIRGLFTTPNEEFQDLVVCLHGYTGHKNENNFLFKQLATLFAENDIATLRYDYMGSGDSDGKFQDQNFDTVLQDAKSAILDGYKLNNNQPIILLGFSMGGACAARMSVEMNNYIKKLVLMSPAGGMCNMLTRTFNNNLVVDNQFVDLGGYYLNKKFLESFQTKNLYESLDTFTKDVLITQGTADLAVSPTISYKYKQIYPNAKYVLIVNATHGYAKVKHRMEVQSVILEFLKKK